MPEVFHGSVDGVLSETHSFARPLVALNRPSRSQRKPTLSCRTSASPVSVIFRSGKIYTVDDAKSWAQAVAIAGDTIVAVGSDVEIITLATRDTKVVDLRGRMLMPGFVEGHIHPFMGSFMTSGVDLQVPTAQAALAAIELYAKAHPAGPIRGFGWRVDMFPSEGPTRQVLDAVLPNRPAFFFSIDGHSLWANSKALEIAGSAPTRPIRSRTSVISRATRTAGQRDTFLRSLRCFRS